MSLVKYSNNNIFKVDALCVQLNQIALHATLASTISQQQPHALQTATMVSISTFRRNVVTHAHDSVISVFLQTLVTNAQIKLLFSHQITHVLLFAIMDNTIMSVKEHALLAMLHARLVLMHTAVIPVQLI